MFRTGWVNFASQCWFCALRPKVTRQHRLDVDLQDAACDAPTVNPASYDSWTLQSDWQLHKLRRLDVTNHCRFQSNTTNVKGAL